MGMYNDYRNTNRESWNFTYTGKELKPFAERRREEFKEKEEKFRTRITALLGDTSVKSTNIDIEQCKNEIENNAELREKCEIWIYEFGRNPDREYSLKLGDVSFFDLHVPIDQ